MSYPPPPMFASAGNAQHGDDFDFHEVFADYFVNEFNDPFNAYTGGMANYNPVGMIPMTFDGASDPNAVKGSNSVSLPTGGIKTAFHTTAAVAASSQQLGSTIEQPGAKKAKTEDATDRIIPGIEALMQQQQPQPTLATSADPGQYGEGGIRVSLPVGVGIRLGTVVPDGSGGFQSAVTSSSASGFNFTQMVQAAASASGSGGGSSSGTSYMWNLFNNQGMAEGVSEQAVVERRERNREHAKRSRVRKKFILESLQEQVRQLQEENRSLRLMVQEHIPEQAMQIFDECCLKNILFADSSSFFGNKNGNYGGDDSNMDGGGGNGIGIGGFGGNQLDQGNMLVRTDFSLMQALTSGQKCFVLSDPKLPDNPIVFATNDFYTLTGYTPKEVLGRNCRFLQGPGTDKRAVDVLRKAVQVGADGAVCLLNYKADGTPFWNQLFLGALRDSDNNIVNYVGVLTEVEPESAAPSILEDKVNMVHPLQDKNEAMDEH